MATRPRRPVPPPATGERERAERPDAYAAAIARELSRAPRQLSPQIALEIRLLLGAEDQENAQGSAT